MALVVAMLTPVFMCPTQETPQPSGEAVREAFQALFKAGPVRFVWKPDETAILYLQPEKGKGFALREYDLLERRSRTLISEFESAYVGLALTSDGERVVAWSGDHVSTTVLAGGTIRRIYGRFSEAGCVTPDDRHFVVWGCLSDSRCRSAALLEIDLMEPSLPSRTLHDPVDSGGHRIESAGVALSPHGTFVLDWRLTASGPDGRDATTVSIGRSSVDGVISRIVVGQYPPYARPPCVFRGEEYLFTMGSRDEGRRDAQYALQLDIRRAIADGKIQDNEWTPAVPSGLHFKYGMSLAISPDMEVVAYSWENEARRQTVGTSVFRALEPEGRKRIDSGVDSADVHWSPRGSFCVSRVGLRNGHISWKVLTRADIEALLTMEKQDNQ